MNDMKYRLYKMMSNTGLEFLKKLGEMMLLVSMLVGCYDDGVEGDSYYVFEGQTIGDYLDADSRYSEFSVILERAGMKGLMYAYGDYTCFAPTNEAVEHYINSYFPGTTLETLPDSAVEAVAKSHLIGAKYMTSDFSTGYLQEPNMYDRRVQVNIDKEFDAALGDSATVYLLNGSARIILANDTVSNGVVHTVDHVLEQSSYVLPDYMESLCENQGFTLFMEALKQTHLTDSMLKEADESPEMLSKLARFASDYTATGQKVPSARKFGYTVFVEKDDVFKNIYDPQNMGKPVYTGDLVSDMRSLFNYAKSIYDKVYPEDAGLYDGDYTHPKNPLNRFMAYHIMDRNAGYSDLVVTTNDWSVEEGGNITEYYETMAGWYCPDGYFDDVYYDNQTICYYSRWPQGQDAGHSDLANFKTDNMKFNGEYDVTLRLPAVPAGPYEIRIGYEANGLMSITQIYFGYDRDNMTPTGIPLDMNMVGSDPKVGMIQDAGLFDDINMDPIYNTGGQTTITENDKAMRNLGYMKGPYAMYRVNADRVSKGARITNNWWYLRHIVTTQELNEKPFYLRFRKVDERSNRILNIDFVEIVPRSVYNGATLEDRN